MVDLFRTSVGSAALGSHEADIGVSMGAEVSSEAWPASPQFQGLMVVVNFQVLEGLSFFATCLWWTLHSLLQGLSKWQLRRWPVASQPARESLGMVDIAILDKISISTQTRTLNHLCYIFFGCRQVLGHIYYCSPPVYISKGDICKTWFWAWHSLTHILECFSLALRNKCKWIWVILQ